MRSLLLISALLAASVSGVSAQSEAGAGPEAFVSLGELEQARVRVNRRAMVVLGSWAAANIVSAVPGWLATEDAAQGFFEMNAAWNVVNLGLATAGLLGARSWSPAADLGEAAERQYSLEKILLLNVGLNVAYMASGVALLGWAPRAGDQEERLTGYGASLLLQGGFLFVFDLVYYAATRRAAAPLRARLRSVGPSGP